LCYRIKNAARKLKKDDNDNDIEAETEGTQLESEFSSEEKAQMLETLQLKFKNLSRDVVIPYWRATVDIRADKFFWNREFSCFEIISKFRYLKESYAPELVDNDVSRPNNCLLIFILLSD
jgi:hypothetical protein